MTQNITPGTAATLVYVTDSRAMVVSRVSPSGTRLWARAVELGPVRHEREIPAGSGEPPVTLQDGILDQPYGDEVQYSLRKSGRWIMAGQPDSRDASRLVLGHSVRRVDYKM